MKTKFLLPSLLIITLLFIAGFREIKHHSLTGSCDAGKKISSYKEITLSKAKVLAAHKWKVQETIQNLNCENVHYIRDKVNTTGYDQGILRLTFNESGTGTYIDCKGKMFNIRWEFIDGNETDMRINVIGLLQHEWNMVAITDDYIMETVKIEGLGMVTAKWVPDNDCLGFVSNK